MDLNECVIRECDEQISLCRFLADKKPRSDILNVLEIVVPDYHLLDPIVCEVHREVDVVQSWSGPVVLESVVLY